MAILKLGAIVTELNGKLGGSALQMQGGRCIAFKKSMPQVRTTVLNQRSKSFHISILARYKTLTNQQKNQWKAFANSCDYGLFCNSKNRPSGFNLFVACNKNRFPFGTVGILSPKLPSVVCRPVFNQPTFIRSLGRTTFTGTWYNYSGWYFTYYSTAPLSAGAVPKKGSFRYMGVTTITSQSQSFVNTKYQTTWGFLPPAGSTIFVKAKLIHAASGAVSADYIFKISVV